MQTFTITVDDSDRGEVTARPWTANLVEMLDDESGEVLATGFGDSPAEAVADLLRDGGEFTKDRPNFHG